MNKSKLQNRTQHDAFRKGTSAAETGVCEFGGPGSHPAPTPPGDVETICHLAVEVWVEDAQGHRALWPLRHDMIRIVRE